MRSSLLIISLYLCALLCSAQDIHFSQFYQSPFSLNPSFTGSFDGEWRFIGNQRTQWRAVTTPFNTYGVSAEWKNERLKGFDLGISFFNDRTGDSRLTTNMFNLFAAYSWKLDDNQSFRAGLGVGFTSMSIDYTQLRYDNQWNGIAYDPTLSSQENFTRDARAYMNVHLGISYIRKMGEHSLTGGIGLFNLTSPDQSWFDQAFVRLNPRWNVHIQYHHILTQTWRVEPAVLVMHQNPHNEVNLGGRVFYDMTEVDWFRKSFYAGAFARARDAGYIIAGLRYDQWDVGVSYDINLSSLRPASNGRGALEFSIIYIIPPRASLTNFKKTCPDYI